MDEGGATHADSRWGEARQTEGAGQNKLDAFRPEIEALLAQGSTQKFIAHRYNTTKANLHNWMKKHRIKNPRTVEPVEGVERGRSQKQG